MEVLLNCINKITTHSAVFRCHVGYLPLAGASVHFP